MTRADTGSDFLQLNPAGAPPKGLTAWLVGALREAIIDRRLPAGSRLPATRTLAADLAISRGVVVEAYQRLSEEGLVAARTGAGTVVSGPQASPNGRSPRPASPSTPRLLVDHPRLPLPPGPTTSVEVDLSPGVPDLSAFPRAAWLRAEREVLAQASGADLGYGDPRGHERLRQQLATWLARTRGVRAEPDDILIVAGVAQALALLAQNLVAHNVTALAVEDPGSRGAREELVHWGLAPLPVPVDDQGLRIDRLSSSGAAAVLVTPAHQFPTGVVLAPERRQALLEWARDTGGLVIEDDYDAEHRYDRAPVPALHAAAPDHVAHAGSVSKTLAPGMRIGWLIPPRRLHTDLVAAKHASDLGSPGLPQLVLAHLLATGDYERHLRHMRAHQRKRRDALLAGLHEHLPEAYIHGVAAGLHLVVTLPHLTGHVHDVDLAKQVHATGILVHPLSWHRLTPGPPGLVLGYAAHTPDRLQEASRRLAQALKTSIKHTT
ncbi:MAG: MocR-like pyridoxine biosynthesis transcription factor PdxR [Actinomycetes bacterium]